MAENVYACIFFNSDKTVSVIPKSRCILRDSFEIRGEVEVKWRTQGKQQILIGTILQVSSKQNKHLLEEYSGQLHLFITSCINEEKDFLLDELIGLWKPNVSGTKTSIETQGPQIKRKRQDTKSRTGKKTKTPNQKKLLDSSALLAGQEIIQDTPFRNVFPTSTIHNNSEHDSSYQIPQEQPSPEINTSRIYREMQVPKTR